MEEYKNPHKRNVYSLSPDPPTSRFHKMHSRFLKLSSKIYPKITPISLIEERSKINIFTKRHQKSTKEKDQIIQNLHKNHIKSQNSCKIVILPKSPFGKHESYNEENDFSNSHFLLEDNPTDPKQGFINRKVGLLNKMIKKSYCSSSKIQKRFNEHIEVFETNTGKMFCKRPVSLINVYDEQCEEYGAFVMGKASSRDLSLKESRKMSKNVFSRLYSPTKKPKYDFYKKFEKIFESKVLKLD